MLHKALKSRRRENALRFFQVFHTRLAGSTIASCADNCLFSAFSATCAFWGGIVMRARVHKLRFFIDLTDSLRRLTGLKLHRNSAGFNFALSGCHGGGNILSFKCFDAVEVALLRSFSRLLSAAGRVMKSRLFTHSSRNSSTASSIRRHVEMLRRVFLPTV